MDFPTKNDHFGVVLGVPPFKETPIWMGFFDHKNLRFFGRGFGFLGFSIRDTLN